MSKLAEKFSRATAVILVFEGGKQKQLMNTERHACINALKQNTACWEQRCAALYQVIGCMADTFGIFETSDDVSDALDVAAGRGDIGKLLPWPKADLRTLVRAETK
jgi:hypothetical protein